MGKKGKGNSRTNWRLQFEKEKEKADQYLKAYTRQTELNDHMAKRCYEKDAEISDLKYERTTLIEDIKKTREQLGGLFVALVRNTKGMKMSFESKEPTTVGDDSRKLFDTIKASEVRAINNQVLKNLFGEQQ